MDSSDVGNMHCCKYVFQSTVNNRMTNSVGPDETSHYEQSQQDLLFAK